MFGIGPIELIVVLVVALLVFGPKRLPDFGRSLGSGMREFKESVTGADRDELANADAPVRPSSSPSSVCTVRARKPLRSPLS